MCVVVKEKEDHAIASFSYLLFIIMAFYFRKFIYYISYYEIFVLSFFPFLLLCQGRVRLVRYLSRHHRMLATIKALPEFPPSVIDIEPILLIYNASHGKSVTYFQFPVTLAYAITDYKMSGPNIYMNHYRSQEVKWPFPSIFSVRSTISSRLVYQFFVRSITPNCDLIFLNTYWQN